MLFEHNIEPYKELKEVLLKHHICCFVAATGIGKSNVAIELITEFNFKALIIVPKVSIRKNWISMSEKYNLSENITAVTYQYFVRHYMELLDFNIYIFDEAHHAGSLIWGEYIKRFKRHLTDDMYVLGLTADPNRYFDRNEGKIHNVIETIFNNRVVYGMDRYTAIINGILPNASYISAIYDKNKLINYYLDLYGKIKNETAKKLKYLLEDTDDIQTILQRHAPKDIPIKGIAFVDSINNISSGIDLIKETFPDLTISYIHSGLSKKENNETLEFFEESESGFIVVVDMLNEGLHIPGVNMLIMMRKTFSPTVYFQQMGRGLTASGKNLVIYDLVCNDDTIKSVFDRIDEVKNQFSAVGYGVKDIAPKDKPRQSNDITKIECTIKDYSKDILNVLKEIDDTNRTHRHWTNDEEGIIRKYYPIEGAKVSKRLPNRSVSSCRLRAYQLGVKYSNKNAWTEDEDNILRCHYHIIGPEVYIRIEDRSKSDCIERAKELGLVYDSSKVWTRRDDLILVRFFPNITPIVLEMLNGKSKEECMARASEIGLVDRRIGRKWTLDPSDVKTSY